MNKAVDKLESVKATFGHWRETRTSQGKIPDYHYVITLLMVVGHHVPIALMLLPL